MERLVEMPRIRKREKQPRRVIFLKLLCVFSGIVLGVLLLKSPAVAMLFAEEEQKGDGKVDAPFIDQRDKYPTGCESVTAVMALQYAGVEITVE